GSGLERLLIALDAQGVQLPREAKPLVWLVSLGDAAKDANLQLLAELRTAGVASDMDYTGRGARGQFKLADREGATLSIITGETELAAGTVVIKDLRSGE